MILDHTLSSTSSDGCASDSLDQLWPTKNESNLPDYPTGSNGAGAIARVLRSNGIQCQVADPRLVALVEQGVSVETMLAAVAQAKQAKPHERIPIGYVLKILESMAKQAAALRVRGAGDRPETYGQKMARVAAEMTGRLPDSRDPGYVSPATFDFSDGARVIDMEARDVRQLA